jgi:glycosyltransferase involved in cell wall biosynthesis
VRVAIVHDYLTQRGGAERVVLAMSRAFPDAPIYTSLYDPDGTFPEFRDLDVRTSVLQRIPGLARRHRLGLPLYAPVFSRMKVDADVVLCSSSGWAHGVRCDGPKVVYCYNPARWLYQADEYEGGGSWVGRVAIKPLRQVLVRWDRSAALSADAYLTSSSIVAKRIQRSYGIEACLVPPPPALLPGGRTTAVAGIEPGFVLCVSRLLPYKNVHRIVEAFQALPKHRLVVLGDGPLRETLAAAAGDNVTLLQNASDDELHWLYDNCLGLVAASREDFGLTPLEAASFGKPSAVLRWGGFLDTMTDETAVFFEDPTPLEIARAIEALVTRQWDSAAIEQRAALFDERHFADHVARLVDSSTADAVGLESAR